MFTYRSGRTPSSNRVLCISTVIFFMLLFSATVSASFELYIGTGSADSFSYFAGKTICSSVKKHEKNVTCKLVPASESTDTLTNLQNGSLDLVLASSKTIYDALNSAGLFQYIAIDYNDLRLLMPFYKSPISLIVRRDAKIAKLDDLKGKRVNGGAFNSLENQIFNELMKVKKWTKGSFSLYQNLPHSNAQDFLALKGGSVQAMLHAGMHPDAKLKLLLSQKESTLLPLDDSNIQQMIEDKSGFCSSKISGQMYRGVDGEMKTLGMETFLLTSADADENTVELVLGAINEAKDQLQHVHPSFMQERIEISTLKNSYLKPHPSAIHFFSE